MDIAILAAGALGGYLGARLADGGQQVSVIARGKHLDAIRTSGLKLESALGDTTLKPARATDDPAEIGPVDIVIFAVKLWDTETAALAAKPLIGADTQLITFQNGVESADTITSVIGDGHANGGVGYISATISAPGRIVHNGEFARFIAGPPNGRTPPPKLKEFAAAATKAGVDFAIAADIDVELWKKFIFFSAFSAVTAGARCTMGDIRKDEAIGRVFEGAMAETAAVASARGVALPGNVVDALLETAAGMPDSMRATMANDIAAGNRLEARWLGGAVSRFGRELGIATPLSDALYAVVRPFANGAQG